MSFECPADGCDYSGLKTSVASHYQAITDGKHPGSRSDCLQIFEDSESTNAGESVDESTNTAQSENPTFGSADPVQEPEPEPGSGDCGSQPEEYVCLACGGEVYDFSGYQSGKMHDINGHSIMVAGDYQCAECGEWFIDE